MPHDEDRPASCDQPGLPPGTSTLDLHDVALGAVVHAGEKSMLVTGDHGGRSVIVKLLRTDEDFWAATFAHEARLYAVLTAHPPPVRVPRLVHTNFRSVLVIEHLPGTVLDRERYPEHPLPEDSVATALAAVTEFAGWRPPAGALSPVFDYPERVERYHQQGWFTRADRDALHTLLNRLPAPETPAHGDPLPTNLLHITGGGGALLDFEFTGLYLPGYDLAVLHTLLARTPSAQHRIENHVIAHGMQAAFLVNQVLVLARERRLHTEMPADALREQRLALLHAQWDRVQQRLH